MSANSNNIDVRKIKAILWMLCVIFILGNLCMQAFNLVFQDIGNDLGYPEYASLITSIPGIVLGIVSFIYGTLGDFVSLKKLIIFGLTLLIVSSVVGFIFSSNLWLVIISRCFQTAGGQVAGSVYLVITAKYLSGKEKVAFFGIFSAAYQTSVLIGILAGGILSLINWNILFLIPVIAIFFFPYLIKNIPNNNVDGKVHIDILGFIIIGIAVTFLTLYFTNFIIYYLILSIVFFIIFAVYIVKAKNPFITIAFFKNRRWILASLLVFIFYFYNYSLTPTFNAAGDALFSYTSAQVSFILVPAFITSLLVSVNSGFIIDKIGRNLAMIIAPILMVVGFFSTAFGISYGPVFIAVTACIFYAGIGLIYAPIYDTVVDTVPANEEGRALGINDLVLNVTASIGLSVFAPLMKPNPEAGTNIFGLSGNYAVYSNLFLIFGCIALFGLIVYILVRKYIQKN